MATNIKITEYEVEAEDYSPETTKHGQVVVYFRVKSEAETQLPSEESEEKLQALIYRTKITLQSDGTRVVIYTDAVVKAKFPSRSSHIIRQMRSDSPRSIT
jgi:hypothetical protein